MGSVLATEKVTSSETAVMKALLTSVVGLAFLVLSTITNAQESELQVVEHLWTNVPPKSVSSMPCARRGDWGLMRTAKSRRSYASSCGRRSSGRYESRSRGDPQASSAEAEQLSVIDSYALRAPEVLTALNRDGTLPFGYPAVQSAEELDEVEASLERLSKRRSCDPGVSKKLARLRPLSLSGPTGPSL
jgi:hypothetical protein